MNKVIILGRIIKKEEFMKRFLLFCKKAKVVRFVKNEKGNWILEKEK